MPTIQCSFESSGAVHFLDLVFVEGTRGRPYTFGDENASRTVELPDFFISTFPVTQALWTHVMGVNASVRRGDHKPVENVSWDEITRDGGFFDRINSSALGADLANQLPGIAPARFRLPAETEWEYAARGGPHWPQGFRFSGSNHIDAVAWYQANSGNQTHDVGQKAANQLGLHDMCGNVWEWCQDAHTPDISRIPTDGSPFAGDSSDRILRGGCHHNWAIHCTVSKRYEIAADYRDGCIGFRLVLSAS
jgi:formylglycine-generating enzyme required for sulfatase activity